jgi:hypothetical protein
MALTTVRCESENDNNKRDTAIESPRPMARPILMERH